MEGERIVRLIALPSAVEWIGEIQARAIVLGLSQHHTLAAKLIALCCDHRRFSLLNRARLIFREITRPSLCVWNAWLRVLAAAGESEENLAVFVRMKKAWIKPDRFTFPSLLKACSDLNALIGGAVHGEVIRTGVGGDPHIHVTLIFMYSKRGSPDCAVKVFEEIRSRDAAAWNCIIACFLGSKEISKGREIFERMKKRNTVSWNTLISGYVQNGLAVEALQIFKRMQIEGSHPSEATLVSVLSACSQVGALHLGKWIHKYIDLSNKMSLKLCNSLIDMYAKGGSLELAQKLFGGMPERSLISWNCMIHALALHGQGKEAIHLFEEMPKVGLSPDTITFVGILSACAHAGLFEEGRFYFDAMEKTHGIAPQIEHYGCMVNILCRGGQISEARRLIGNMPVPPDAGVWGTFLGACLRHGQLDFAKDALAHLLDLEPWNAGNYVLLSNRLAAGGHWSDVECVRIEMKQSLVKKIPGLSSIEIDQSIWEFVSGDRSHPQSEEIYAILEVLDMLVKVAGYNIGPVDCDHTLIV